VKHVDTDHKYDDESDHGSYEMLKFHTVDNARKAYLKVGAMKDFS
jgi:hypothetical protein